jgi:hypothetical protein
MILAAPGQANRRPRLAATSRAVSGLLRVRMITRLQRGHRGLMAVHGTPREQTQLRFRKANEGLIKVIQKGSAHRRIPFLCECADDACFGRVELYLAQWEAVAAQHNHFLIQAGHQRSEGEEVVGHEGGYEIAGKPN